MLRQVDNTGLVMAEVLFEYNGELLERTVYNFYRKIGQDNITTYTVIDSFFYSDNGKLLMASNSEQSSQICVLDSRFIYENNEIS